jgi:hypothetical protein
VGLQAKRLRKDVSSLSATSSTASHSKRQRGEGYPNNADIDTDKSSGEEEAEVEEDGADMERGDEVAGLEDKKVDRKDEVAEGDKGYEAEDEDDGAPQVDGVDEGEEGNEEEDYEEQEHDVCLPSPSTAPTITLTLSEFSNFFSESEPEPDNTLLSN